MTATDDALRETAMVNLMKVMCLPSDLGLVEITRTSDGYYLGRSRHDLGFNEFIGRPRAPHPGPGQDQTRAVWAALSESDRKAVVALARHLGIDLDGEFGLGAVE